jgi:hypothetical protein
MFRTRTLGVLLSVLIHCHAHLQDSYTKLRYGHRLDRKMIDSFVGYSILDCVEECLRTTRCTSLNLYKGANYCEINYENKSTASDRFLEIPVWIYSEKGDWYIVSIMLYFSLWSRNYKGISNLLWNLTKIKEHVITDAAWCVYINR